jgi:hypothetical protein
MMKKQTAVLAAALGGVLCAVPARTEPFAESPITPGFWVFPRKAVTAAPDILALCRAHVEIRFADGHFIGLRAQKREMNLTQHEVETVGRCAFNRDKQADVCDIKNIHSDGSILAGAFEIKYALDSRKVLKMTVTPKMITDSPVDNAPYDAFPVRCPDDAAWTILGETAPPK